MICPNCNSYTLFIKKSKGRKSFCRKCAYEEDFIQPSYDSYQERTYENTLIRNEKNDPLIRTTIKSMAIKKNDLVLEYGVGSGHMTRVISEYSDYVIGIDIDISLAAKNYPKLMFKQQIPNQPLSLPDNSVDKIICMNTIEHIYDFDLLLKEFKRVLKRDGQIFICTGNNDFFIPFMDKTHVIEWNKVEFETLIAKYFKIKKSFSCGSFFNYYPLNKIIVIFLKPIICILGEKK